MAGQPVRTSQEQDSVGAWDTRQHACKQGMLHTGTHVGRAATREAEIGSVGQFAFSSSLILQPPANSVVFP